MLYINKKLIRKNFSKHKQIIKIPNLLNIQKKSFNEFIYGNSDNEFGINYAFKSIFPIFSYNKNAELRYVNFKIENSNFNYNECKIKGITYSLLLKARLKLIIYEKNFKDKIKKEIEQEVYIGDIPNMTENSSFIINGVEKVIVSQLHRSPGVFFDILKDKSDSQKCLYNARIIPYRGSWLDFEFDYKDRIYSRIDRKRKFPVTMLFKSINYKIEDILKIFDEKLKVIFFNLNFYLKIDTNLLNKKFNFDLIINEKIIIKKNVLITDYDLNNLLKNKFDIIKIKNEYLLNKIILENHYINNKIIINSGKIINLNILEIIKNNKIKEFYIIDIDNSKYLKYIIETLKIDYTNNSKDAISEIYKIIKPGELSSIESLENSFKLIFFSSEKYDLSKVGRLKLNESINRDKKETILDYVDFVSIIKKLIDIKNGDKNIDDIDNLGNRRIKSAGEMIENQFRIGLLRMEKNIKDRLSINDLSNITPKKIISKKQLTSIIKDFFNSSQLSQFMDQNNPLAEITHKRRISALGPGGLTRERAGFEVRDVHSTHYGRLCPIETPEGPNIGLINSLSIYSKINNYGFLETPYQIVENGIVTKKIDYLSSSKEFNFIIAQANTKIDKNNKFIDHYIICRYKGEFSLFKYNKINYIDVSNQQIVSIGASLIPFLEHNDANRALMGSNMLRQAVSLINAKSPMVSTGMELKISKDSNASIFSKRSGIVSYVDSNYIIIKVNKEELYDKDDIGIDIYKLKKFNKSNQNTCINYIPCVNLNDKINKNYVLSDSQSTNLGELSLGKDIKVAFMSWYGYNFEDSMIISERLIRDNVFTSIHIQEFSCVCRDTKLGPEEITSDIPNVSESLLLKLDKSGIIHIGSYVNQGDILVGKVTPKGESQLTPEEKLLRAIFGEKVSDVKDSSLRVPNGLLGTVINVQIFTKEGIKKDKRSIEIENSKLEEFIKYTEEEKCLYKSVILERIKNIFNNLNINFDFKFLNINNFIKIKTKIDNGNVLYKKLLDLIKNYNDLENYFQNKINNYKNNIEKYDELPNDVLKIVKIYIAIKKQIQPGDKMAGRHGNKGVVSKINLIEDMPYDSDGVPIDIILNPLGVPSRMNIGQILEAHLGLSLKFLGNKIKNILEQKNNINLLRKYLDNIYNNLFKDVNYQKVNFDEFTDNEIYVLCENLKHGLNISTPVFDGININEIKKLLLVSGIDESGQIYLFNGFNGEMFDRKITVGYIYMMKLNHLVDDKMHARSTGSYSLITQQPLGGKAQFGGQRFGEMEVWALEAYGAAYTLQEMLTVKSDDVDGRIDIYKNIINGNYNLNIKIPESFNVLFKEIRSLGINIELDEID